MDNIIHIRIMIHMDSINLIKYSGSRQLLETLLNYSNRQFTINELAKEAKVPFASTWRLVQKWEPAGLIETGRVGRSVTVKLHKSDYLDSILSLLKISATPQAFTVRALRGILAGEKEVKEAHLFGSVARGDETLKSDIDLALLAGKGFNANGLAYSVYEKYGTKLVPLVFSRSSELNAFTKGKKTVRLK